MAGANLHSSACLMSTSQRLENKTERKQELELWWVSLEALQVSLQLPAAGFLGSGSPRPQARRGKVAAELAVLSAEPFSLVAA